MPGPTTVVRPLRWWQIVMIAAAVVVGLGTSAWIGRANFGLSVTETLATTAVALIMSMLVIVRTIRKIRTHGSPFDPAPDDPEPVTVVRQSVGATIPLAVGGLLACYFFAILRFDLVLLSLFCGLLGYHVLKRLADRARRARTPSRT